MPASIAVRVQAQDFDVGAEIEALHDGRRDVGAVVSFSGLCRDEAEAAARWPDVTAVTVIHRHGRIAPGGRIVLVVTASPHRTAAFQAAEFLMDFLKTRAPFWKKEHRTDGTSGDWVAAKDADDAKAGRW
jgi:molybdopterin synthase catalytic subunit